MEKNVWKRQNRGKEKRRNRKILRIDEETDARKSFLCLLKQQQFNGRKKESAIISVLEAIFIAITHFLNWKMENLKFFIEI